MPIIITIASIFIIALLMQVLNKFSPIKVCAICAGVSGTWLWMLAGILTDMLSEASYQLPAAILMGGSVVGIAYQMEKRLAAGFSPFLWKILFIPAGFAMVYSLLSRWWVIFSVILVYLIAIVLLFWRRRISIPLSKKDTGKVEELKNKMKICC